LPHGNRLSADFNGCRAIEKRKAAKDGRQW
jgi:hypothetical protein